MAKRQRILPRVHVLVLCDDVEPNYEDDELVHLYGVRTLIEATSFPHIQSQLCVYLQVTGYQGNVAGTISLAAADSDEPLQEEPLPTFRLLGPLVMVSLWVRLQNCIFPEPGVYYVQVKLQGVLVGERFLEVMEV